jgi:hypothetical protein
VQCCAVIRACLHPCERASFVPKRSRVHACVMQLQRVCVLDFAFLAVCCASTRRRSRWRSRSCFASIARATTGTRCTDSLCMCVSAGCHRSSRAPCRIGTYYASKTLSDLPFQFFFPILFISILYWMCGASCASSHPHLPLASLTSLAVPPQPPCLLPRPLSFTPPPVFYPAPCLFSLPPVFCSAPCLSYPVDRRICAPHHRIVPLRRSPPSVCRDAAPILV